MARIGTRDEDAVRSRRYRYPGHSWRAPNSPSRTIFHIIAGSGHDAPIRL